MAGPKPKTVTPEKAKAMAAAARLRERGGGALVSAEAEAWAAGGGDGVPRALARSDGADIVKKNAKKKNYLFAFPGGLSLPAGARVGALHGLDTATPTLDIACPDGRLRLRGALFFPRNTLLTMRGAAPARPVRVVDTFETVVVFSEWAWLGRAADNPGDVPKPLPAAMAAGDGSSVWSAGKVARPGAPRKPGGKTGAAKSVSPNAPDALDAADALGAEDAGDGLGESRADNGGGATAGQKRRRVSGVPPSSPSDELEVDVDSSGSDVYRNLSVEVSDVGPARSNPRRGKRVDFSKMFQDDDLDDEDDGEDDSSADVDAEGEPDQGVTRRARGKPPSAALIAGSGADMLTVSLDDSDDG